jgi:hypothetical protein
MVVVRTGAKRTVRDIRTTIEPHSFTSVERVTGNETICHKESKWYRDLCNKLLNIVVDFQRRTTRTPCQMKRDSEFGRVRGWFLPGRPVNA